MRNSLECDASLLSIALIAFARLPSFSLSLSLSLARSHDLYRSLSLFIANVCSRVALLLYMQAYEKGNG